MEEDSPLKVKLLSENAQLPQKGSPGSAGYDLYSACDYIVLPEGKALIATDIAIALPPGTYGRIAPRSGLSWSNHTSISGGVIDRPYRGALKVVLFNHAKENFEVKKGDRIAQLILEKIASSAIVQVDELDATERGANGFGSTGVSKIRKLEAAEDAKTPHASTTASTTPLTPATPQFPLLSMILAVSKNDVIGKSGKIPWHLPKDLAHFKKVTEGKVIIMGRKTFESFPKGKPLPKRFHIVLSRKNAGVKTSQVQFVKGIPECLDLLLQRGCTEAFVIGGEKVFNDFLPLVSKVYLTKVETEVYMTGLDTQEPVYFETAKLKEDEWNHDSEVLYPSESGECAFSIQTLSRK